jgi:hypothetical protein
LPILKIDHSTLTQIELDGCSAYIMSNTSLETLLFDRGLAELPFAHACREASEEFLRHLSAEISECQEDIAELVILSKGLCYFMYLAFEKVFARNLATNFIATKRASVQGTAVRIEVPYSDFSAPATNLIIADTVASGATIIAVLEKYLTFNPLKRIFLFSIAGSAAGARAIATFCKAHNIDLTVVFGLAAFGLAVNGFDLSFLHPETICVNTFYVERARRVFKDCPISAIGWDFGSQIQSPKKYRMLCWIEAEYWNLQNSNIFPIKEPVTDRRLVEKEASAYRNRVEIIDGIADAATSE